MLFKTDKVAAEMHHEGKLAEDLGLGVRYLSKEEVSKLETGTTTDVIGGVHYTSDAHLYPQKFMQFLKQELVELDVSIYGNTEVTDFTIQNGLVTAVETNKGSFIADEVILATGSWSYEIANKLQENISILPGKGYSFTLKNKKTKPNIPVSYTHLTLPTIA